MSCWVNMEGQGQFGWGMNMMMMMDQEGWRKGPWTAEEDRLLTEYVRLHGEGRWNSVARLTGLKRNGKSCRLRWVNYLRPDLKRGQITPHEESIILELHARWGNRWSTIARSLPGRTDNEIKNYWRTHFKSKAKVPPCTSEKMKARLLKRKQFQQQQQEKQKQKQPQPQPQPQQQPQLSQLDIKRIMSLLDETENSSHTIAYASQLPRISTNMAATIAGSYSTSDDEQAGSSTCYSTLNTNSRSNINSNSTVLVPESSGTEELLLWDGSLWNLDDFHGINNCGVASASSCKPTPFLYPLY